MSPNRWCDRSTKQIEYISAFEIIIFVFATGFDCDEGFDGEADEEGAEDAFLLGY